MQRYNAATWIITEACNTVCSYCIAEVQFNHKKIGHPDRRSCLEIVEGLSKLDNYRIHISGGEPFAVDGFVEEIIPALMKKTNHSIVVTSNSIVSTETYIQFLRETGDRLLGLNFSYHAHLHKGKEDQFLEKVVAINEEANKLGQTFGVYFPLVPKSLYEIKDLIAKLRDQKISTFSQHLKHPTKKMPIKYSAEQQDVVAELMQRTTLGEGLTIGHYKGMECRAGSQYLAIRPEGNVYACATALGLKYQDLYVGNIKEQEFQIMQNPVICPFDACTCFAAKNCGATPYTDERREVSL